jgi:hypothetical protein
LISQIRDPPMATATPSSIVTSNTVRGIVALAPCIPGSEKT